MTAASSVSADRNPTIYDYVGLIVVLFVVLCLDIPYQLWIANLSLNRPSPIGVKLMTDERSVPMTHWARSPLSPLLCFIMLFFLSNVFHCEVSLV